MRFRKRVSGFVGKPHDADQRAKKARNMASGNGTDATSA